MFKTATSNRTCSYGEDDTHLSSTHPNGSIECIEATSPVKQPGQVKACGQHGCKGRMVCVQVTESKSK